MTGTSFLDDEFWWVSAAGSELSGWVGVALSHWTPPPNRPGWQVLPERVEFRNLESWAASQEWINVHRTIAVFDSPTSAVGIEGPYVIDLDAEEGDDGEVSERQLETRCEQAVMIAKHYLASGVTTDHVRLYYSGHKGFHVEIVFPERPEMHRLRASRGPWIQEHRGLWKTLGTSVAWADPAHHQFVRLKRSINRWTDSARVTRLTMTELESSPISELAERAAL